MIRKIPFVECFPGSDLPNPAHRDHVLLPVQAVKPLKRAFEAFRAELFALVPEGYAAATRLPVAVADRVANLLPHLRHVLARIDAVGRPGNDPPSPGAYWCVKEPLLPAALEVDRLMVLPIAISGGPLTISECENSILYRLTWAWRHLDAGPALFGGWLAYHPEGVPVFGAVLRELEEMASSLGVTNAQTSPVAPASSDQDRKQLPGPMIKRLRELAAVGVGVAQRLDADARPGEDPDRDCVMNLRPDRDELQRLLFGSFMVDDRAHTVADFGLEAVRELQDAYEALQFTDSIVPQHVFFLQAARPRFRAACEALEAEVRQHEPTPGKKKTGATRIGPRQYRAEGEQFCLTAREDAVIEALMASGPMDGGTLTDRSGWKDAPRVLRNIVQKYPLLRPYMRFPGKRGGGGYSTTIQPE
jgi:hypothetical protein